jgi:hypothetical protein
VVSTQSTFFFFFFFFFLGTKIGGLALAGPGGEQRSAGSPVNYKGCL